MKSVRQLLLGLITAVGSIVLVISAASLSILEGTANIPIGFTSQPAQPVGTAEQIATDIVKPTMPASSPTAAATPVQPTTCPAPEGWTQYIIAPGDTLDDLALQSGTTVDKIREANCLTVSSLFPDTILYLPIKATATVIAPATPTPLPTIEPTIAPTTAITVTATVCAPPSGWVVYIVRPGDTLFRIGLSVGLTTDALRSANCMTNDRLFSGQALYLPFIPARPSTPTQPPATRTPVPTRTRTPIPPTATPVPPTATPVPPTATPVTPTATPVTPTATTPPPPSATPVTPTTPPTEVFTDTPLPEEPTETDLTDSGFVINTGTPAP